jgi:hypothetical protein
MVVLAYNPTYCRGRNRRIMSLRSTQAKLMRPYLKKKTQNNNKRARVVTQVKSWVHLLVPFKKVEFTIQIFKNIQALN